MEYRYIPGTNDIVRIGDVVQYHLRQDDVERINEQRRILCSYEDDYGRIRTTTAFYGNPVETRKPVSLFVTSISDTGLLNGQLILDGNDRLYISLASYGGGPGEWLERG